MPINVFPWPPVGVVAAEWTTIAPVARVRSLLTGRDVMQASQRKRRVATLEVSALAAGRMGAGYCEMLKELLDGGIHAVRLLSSPINWHLDEIDRRRLIPAGGPLSWRTGADPLAWRAGSGPAPLRWFSSSIARAGTATPAGAGFALLPVTGLPPRITVGRPGDFIRIYDLADAAVFETLRLMRPAVTDAAGGVVLKLNALPTITGGRVVMTGQDEAVFRVDGPLPRAVQPVGQDWRYSWSFREVFADEVGGFAERPSVWT